MFSTSVSLRQQPAVPLGNGKTLAITPPTAKGSASQSALQRRTRASR
jgi:hypothetical protein